MVDEGVQVIKIWVIAVLLILGFVTGSGVMLVLFARMVF
jgi:hypothetical protein